MSFHHWELLFALTCWCLIVALALVIRAAQRRKREESEPLHPGSLPVEPLPRVETMDRFVGAMREIGASPENIRIAEAARDSVGIRRSLEAPCIFCAYNGAGYWQAWTHDSKCPWWALGGAWDREQALPRVRQFAGKFS